MHLHAGGTRIIITDIRMRTFCRCCSSDPATPALHITMIGRPSGSDTTCMAPALQLRVTPALVQSLASLASAVPKPAADSATRSPSDPMAGSSNMDESHVPGSHHLRGVIAGARLEIMSDQACAQSSLGTVSPTLPLSLCLSLYLSACHSLSLSLSLSRCVCMCVCVFVCLSVSLSVCLSLPLSLPLRLTCFWWSTFPIDLNLLNGCNTSFCLVPHETAL
jgi:hypothetical protein